MKAIVGVGNILRRDEGLGPAAVQRIERHRTLPDDISAIDAGTGGVTLLDVGRDLEQMAIIDAMRAGGEPGTVYVVRPEQLRSRSPEWSVSLHGTSLLGVIRLAQTVGEPLPDITLIGVEPADLGWGEGLSPAVAAALDEAVDAAIDALTPVDAKV